LSEEIVPLGVVWLVLLLIYMSVGGALCRELRRYVRDRSQWPATRQITFVNVLQPALFTHAGQSLRRTTAWYLYAGAGVLLVLSIGVRVLATQ
jgi:hypothetical protein